MALALLAGASVATVGVAGAHTEVQRAEPGPGEVVDDAPERVELAFLDPVRPDVAMEVTGPDGRAVAGLGAATLDDGNRRATVGFDPLTQPGDYVVTYAFTAEDGDRQEEAYRFTVEAPSEPTDLSGPLGAASAAAGLIVATVLALRRRRG